MYGQEIKKLKVCPFPFMYLHVNSDGTVAGCTLDWARKVLVGDKENMISLKCGMDSQCANFA